MRILIIDDFNLTKNLIKNFIVKLQIDEISVVFFDLNTSLSIQELLEFDYILLDHHLNANFSLEGISVETGKEFVSIVEQCHPDLITKIYGISVIEQEYINSQNRISKRDLLTFDRFKEMICGFSLKTYNESEENNTL